LAFNTSSVQTYLNDEIFPEVFAVFSASHVRFKTTYSVFMHFLSKGDFYPRGRSNNS